MSGPRFADRLLRHDRSITVAALCGVVAAAAFILAGGGTGMSVLGMSVLGMAVLGMAVLGMADSTGPAGALLARTPEVMAAVRWTPGYAGVVFVMWWLMMVAMLMPSAAPSVLRYGALNGGKDRWATLWFVCGYLAIRAGFSGLATAAQGSCGAWADLADVHDAGDAVAGCCRALLALLFVGGIMNIWWILAITLYVAVEKLAPGGGSGWRGLLASG